jgi:CheY-like chemotaxis protein
MPHPRKIVAVLDDLMFTVKISEAAKRAGLAAEFVKSETDALLKAREEPALMILDLNCAAVDAVHLIRQLKSREETRGVRLVAYVSHVHGELKQRAQQAGCDIVLARSAFTQNLPQILKRRA